MIENFVSDKAESGDPNVALTPLTPLTPTSADRHNTNPDEVMNNEHKMKLDALNAVNQKQILELNRNQIKDRLKASQG